MKKNMIKVIGIVTGIVICLITMGGLFFAEFDANNATLEISESSIEAESTTEVSTTKIIETSSFVSTSTTTSISTTSETTVSEATTLETTIPVVEVKTTTVNKPIETIENKENTPQSTQEVSVSIVYKPATHYIHKSNCRWYDGSCYEINSTEGLECRKCSECNPEIEIITEYVQPSINSGTNLGDLSDWDITLLRKIVSNEYGSDYVPVEEKAKIVASVMNMVNDSRWPSTIEGVLDQTCAPWGFNKYKDHYMSDSIYDAVDYYFENKDTVFAGWTCNQWYGDGKWNHFSTI